MINKDFSRRNFIRLASLGMATVPLACKSTKPMATQQRDRNLRFLFQGDSITDGNRGRNADPNHILGHGYCFSVASKIGATYPDRNLQFFNKGISGNTIIDLENRWQQDTLEIKPDVLSLLIGINDVNGFINKKKEANNLTNFEQQYRKLLTSCLNQNKEMLFVLGLPFCVPTGSRKNEFDQWHTPTIERAEVVKSIAKDFNAVLIDYPQVFAQAQKKAPLEYWIWDGIHPTVFGHELMAREWMKQVSNRLSFLKPLVYSI
ncbi:SGNH/GDSL hydrolase family protein [Flectobacillus longus]|uniref:SGNH/GDSL hydrolase family protein n=1 Tax=Flectobacillus longus TaxID=2984207 RepID=UPI0024B7AD70|nr:SGNH/GDSL hydrolase family protein [Flectobacillus longus]MDI9882657.1 SGNH/GDSL hydrolase family protein [Flectobacillus longus]